MQCTLLLDIVVAQSAAILKLFSSENETLLIRRDAFLVLDLGLDIVNGVRGLDIQGDCLAYSTARVDEHKSLENKILLQKRKHPNCKDAALLYLFTAAKELLTRQGLHENLHGDFDVATYKE